MSKQPFIRFLVDESVEYSIVLFLRGLNFDVYSISEKNPSILDPEVLKKAYQQKRVLITNDKGFSDLIFKDRLKSCGIILIRLPYVTTDKKIQRLNQIISSSIKDLTKYFISLNNTQVRFKLLPK